MPLSVDYSFVLNVKAEIWKVMADFDLLYMLLYHYV